MNEKETSRVEAFSDGVFAIAITLLILEIKVPTLPSEPSSGELWRALQATWPSLLAFGISFSAILIMWINHHGLFKLIHKVDSRFLFANGFLLLLITFVPFPTAVLASYLNSTATNAAIAQYCGTYIFISIAYNVLWYSASAKRRLIKETVTDKQIRKIRYAYGLGLPVYGLATALAFISPVTGLLICSSLWILWATLHYET